MIKDDIEIEFLTSSQYNKYEKHQYTICHKQRKCRNTDRNVKSKSNNDI